MSHNLIRENKVLDTNRTIDSVRRADALINNCVRSSIECDQIISPIAGEYDPIRSFTTIETVIASA